MDFTDEEDESQELRGLLRVDLRVERKLDMRHLGRFTLSLLSTTLKKPSDDGIQYLFYGKHVKFGELK